MISIIEGSAPATLGFNAFGPEWLYCGATLVAPAVPAAEPALGSHPCVALSSARVFPEWTQSRLAINVFPANGDYPLNFVSQKSAHCRLASSGDATPPCGVPLAERFTPVPPPLAPFGSTTGASSHIRISFSTDRSAIRARTQAIRFECGIESKYPFRSAS